MEKIRIRRVLVFLLLVFLLSWGFDLGVAAASGGWEYNPAMNPWGMLVPAFVALILQMFFYKDSRIYYKVYKGRPLLIFFGFLALTVVYGVLVIVAAFNSENKRIYQGLGSLLFTLWTLLIFFVRGQCEAADFERAGLQLGDVRIGQRLILGVVVFFLLQAVFNLVFDMGDFAGRAERIYGVGVPQVLYVPALVIMFIFVTVIGIPLSGLAGVFGEEYGWRGFLQGELMKWGRMRGALLVGLVWGVWHFPVILRGIHTYPATAFGLVLAVLFFVLWGFVQSYAVLKTGSIWAAAFMHGVVNSVYSFQLAYIVRPEDKVFSFGLGVFGVACLGAIVAVILRDPIWKEQLRGERVEAEMEGS